MNNVVIGIIGYRGSGKTLLSTYLAYLAYKIGYTIYSNYGLKIDYRRIKTLDFFRVLKEKKVLVLFDEIWTTADSRSSADQKNLALSTIILQSRKKGANLIYTSQDSGQEDKRIRKNTDYYMFPSISLKDAGGKPVLLDVRLCDCLGGYINTISLKVDGITELYDTTEIISPTKTSDYQALIEKYGSLNLPKNVLVSRLIIDDGLKEKTARTLSDYIKSANVDKRTTNDET